MKKIPYWFQHIISISKNSYADMSVCGRTFGGNRQRFILYDGNRQRFTLYDGNRQRFMEFILYV